MASTDVINVIFVDVICSLHRVALNQNRSSVFIWSIEMCFIFFDQISVVLEILRISLTETESESGEESKGDISNS